MNSACFYEVKLTGLGMVLHVRGSRERISNSVVRYNVRHAVKFEFQINNNM
jgi:hypothetical protein